MPELPSTVRRFHVALSRAEEPLARRCEHHRVNGDSRRSCRRSRRERMTRGWLTVERLPGPPSAASAGSASFRLTLPRWGHHDDHQGPACDSSHPHARAHANRRCLEISGRMLYAKTRRTHAYCGWARAAEHTPHLSGSQPSFQRRVPRLERPNRGVLLPRVLPPAIASRRARLTNRAVCRAFRESRRADSNRGPLHYE